MQSYSGDELHSLLKLVSGQAVQGTGQRCKGTGAAWAAVPITSGWLSQHCCSLCHPDPGSTLLGQWWLVVVPLA